MNEIYAFCGSIFLADIFQFAQLEWQWGRRGSLLRLEEFTLAFKWERYQGLRGVVSCPDINQLNHMLCRQIHTFYHESPHLAVDEQLRKFDGRSDQRVVNKDRPAGAGMNAFIVADGVTKCPLWYSTQELSSTELQVPCGIGEINTELPCQFAYGTVRLG